MKKTLKKVALCFCAAALTAFCYPQIKSEAANPENFQTPAFEMNASTDRNSRARKAVKPVAEAVKIAKDAALKADDSAGNNDSVEGENVDPASAYTATAYTLRGRTATGSSTKRGVIAADPRVLPLGTKVRLHAGNWSGTYTVADTGGAVRGRKIDVWVPNSAEARQFGRRKIMLTVINRKRSN